MTSACRLLVFCFACYFLPFFSSIHAKCLSDQRSNLLQFGNAVVSYPQYASESLLNWNESMDCCKWEGVECDDVGHVISLYLENKKFNTRGNEDWKSIFNLQYLEELDLSWGRFEYVSIPVELYNLTRLKYLNLSGSDFTGQVPVGLSKLTSLVTLDLSHVSGLQVGGLELLFQNITQLKQLYLDYVDISVGGNVWCNALSSLSKLQVLSLTGCQLSGPILPSLSNLSVLTTIQLGHNSLDTTIPNYFSNFTNLRILNLTQTDLLGQFPKKIFQIPTLESVDLSYNQLLGGSLPQFPKTGSLKKMTISRTNFSGSLPHSVVYLKGLSELDLSFSSFSGEIPTRFTHFPRMVRLLLSTNNFSGLVPSFSMSPKLVQIDLSHNAFTGALSSAHFKGLINLKYVDLGDNFLSGSFPSSLFALPSLQHLRLSNNHFDGEIEEIQNASSSSLVDLDLQYMSRIVFFSLSHNNIQGNIPKSICNASSLYVLDLSNNFLRGEIPECLFGMVLKNLGVLNLGGNELSGNIPNKFRHNCGLRTLDLSRNILRGKIPTSLANCKSLQVFNVGNNYLEDNFPCTILKEPLSVLVLRSNMFHGEINCSWGINSLSSLQILDVSNNNFNGALPPQLFLNCIGIIFDRTEAPPLQFHILATNENYQDSVKLIIKGLEVELVKILTIYTTLDFSCNNFQGNIPTGIGNLRTLYSLNLSHNAFADMIPRSFGKLEQLQSLDLSTNQLTGSIPSELVHLKFLSFLNLSYNQLIGKIPNSGQLQTFSDSSFLGNKGLCSFPLNVRCNDGLHNNGSSVSVHWEFVSAALGFSVGIGIILCMNIFKPAWWQRFNSFIIQFLFLRLFGVDVLERSYRNPIQRV